MNKKILILIIFIALIVIVGGIIFVVTKNNKTTNEPTGDMEEHQDDEENLLPNVDTENVGKTLVVYFSATNNTEKVARTISEVLSSDLIEIIPKEEYTADDLNYNNDNSRTNKENNDENARPEISNDIELDNYDTIYLGYPIWWGKAPKIILTLLDNYNLEGKDIILFCTSGGSGIETSVDIIKNYNSKLNIITGKKFNSSVSREEIQNWIDNI